MRSAAIAAHASTTIRATSCCSSSTTWPSSISITSASKRFTSRTGRVGVYGGYEAWIDRAGRFRSLGDGQVDFGAIFSKLAQYDYDSWAVLEWECALKHPEDGAREGAEFIRSHIIRVTEKAFDDFAAGGTDEAANRRMLGLDSGTKAAG